MAKIHASILLECWRSSDEPEHIFDYNFDANPLVGDKIREDDKLYTITARCWQSGSLFLFVTDKPTTGVIPA